MSDGQRLKDAVSERTKTIKKMDEDLKIAVEDERLYRESQED